MGMELVFGNKNEKVKEEKTNDDFLARGDFSVLLSFKYLCPYESLPQPSVS